MKDYLWSVLRKTSTFQEQPKGIQTRIWNGLRFHEVRTEKDLLALSSETIRDRMKYIGPLCAKVIEDIQQELNIEKKLQVN